MKKITVLFLSLLLSVGLYAQQEVVVAWTFDNAAALGDTSVFYCNSDIGTQTDAAIYANGTNGSSALSKSGSSPEITAFGGDALNDPRTSTYAGKALTIANSSANGKSIVIKFSMEGFQSAQLTYATRGTSTGFSSHVWAYSTDGVNFTDMQTVASVQSSNWDTRTIDFTSASAINNDSTVYLRLTVSGATNASGNNRLDNIVIKANLAGPDIYPPVVSNVELLNASSLRVTFNEALDATTAETAANYTVNGPETYAAILSNERFVTVNLASDMTEGAQYTLTVNNVADTAGNVMEEYTYNFSFGVDPQYHVANIAELRTKFDYSNTSVRAVDTVIYKITGDVIVTATGAYNHQKVIQDSTAAILIFDIAGKLGDFYVEDKINGVYGILTNYYGFLEFTPVQSAQYVECFQSVDPLVISLSQLNDNNFMVQHQAELITLENTTITSVGNFSVLTRYDLNQGGTTGSALFSYFQDVDYIGNAIPNTAQDITGFNYATSKIGNTNYDYRYYISPRSQYDLSAMSGIIDFSKTQISVYPNPTTDFIHINVEGATSIQLYNINGQMVASQSISNNSTVSMQQFAAGTYFVKVLNNNKEIGFAKVIKK